MKNFLLTLFLTILCVISLTKGVSAYCLVASESGSGTNIYSLPYAVSHFYNGEGSGADCSTDTTDTFDAYYGIEQAMMFATLEWGLARDINEITLKSVLNFDNPDESLVVGNYANDSPAASDYDYDYAAEAASGSYSPVLDDYGIVYIYAKSAFSRGEQPFTCASGTSEVILRSLVINTNQISKNTFFANAPCLRDGGDVYICGGTINTSVEPGDFRWCQFARSSSTEPVPSTGSSPKGGK